ncbi:hypothetical protein E6H33_06065 [Candidatus Bathyarchaeota archaeon]|nr:MAG: hypothetical protein E6H33_06065 [Candidatus Bathyarchaeota archaeon]
MKIRVEITPTVARLLAEYKPASSKGQELESDALQEHYSSKFHDDKGINPGVIVDMIEPPEPPKVAVKVLKIRCYGHFLSLRNELE